MNFILIDFLIGFFLMNAMPHMIYGQTKIRFLNAFGFSWQGNLAYSALNVIIALGLFHWQHGIQTIANHGTMIGALALFVIYLITGKFFYRLFQQ
ncbi:MAG: hypothetical protein KC423_20765 [Anaerolineales bacterium]|nr:hypothetical protein [Anaerolineales bacterium]